jgi:hypothetical protein
MRKASTLCWRSSARIWQYAMRWRRLWPHARTPSLSRAYGRVPVAMNPMPGRSIRPSFLMSMCQVARSCPLIPTWRRGYVHFSSLFIDRQGSTGAPAPLRNPSCQLCVGPVNAGATTGQPAPQSRGKCGWTAARTRERSCNLYASLWPHEPFETVRKENPSSAAATDFGGLSASSASPTPLDDTRVNSALYDVSSSSLGSCVFAHPI